MKVIVISNSNLPAWSGELLGFGADGTLATIPRVQKADGSVWMVFGVVLPESQELWNALKDKPQPDLWNWASQFVLEMKKIQRHSL